MSDRASLADDDFDTTARRLIVALSSFSSIRSTATLRMVTTLLLVATDEGQSVIHYARKGGMSQSVASRNLIELGSDMRNGERVGRGLVEKRLHPANMRAHQIYLTPAGWTAVRKMVDAIQGRAVQQPAREVANAEPTWDWLVDRPQAAS